MTSNKEDSQAIHLQGVFQESINLHHLFIFYAVARTGSFSNAASMLNLTQPAVSIQINELESSLGTTLLHRKQRKLQITDTGEIVLKYAQQIFTLSDELISTLDEIKGLKSGDLVLGASTTPGEYVLPILVGEFRKIHPGITIEITVGNTEDIIQKMSEYKIDLAMVGDCSNDSNEDLEFVKFVTDEI
ncbi:MAG: LysR family transcriptional regulator, partial [SAR202 cluster bacterium]|nr:LysR family transcriptional regulator [SAR202 cluster bacterium]